MAWRFDESTLRPLQDFEAIGLKNQDIAELAQAFHVCGFWRISLEDGLVHCTEHMFKIFELEPQAAPLNLHAVHAMIHPEDVGMVFDTFQRSSETGQTFHCIYRVRSRNGTIKWVRCVGKHSTSDDTGPVIHGVLYEMFQHLPTAAFVIEPQA